MNRKKSFGDGAIYRISNYIMHFFLNTIYFYLCNALLLIGYLIPYGFVVTPESKYILIVTLVFMGPALTALHGTMGKVVRYGDARFLKDYFRCYKDGFKQSFLVWIVIMVIISIFLVDISLFAKLHYGYVGILLYGLCISIIVIASLYIFPIISQFNLKMKDVLKLSIFYAVTNINRTLLIIAIFLLGLFLFELSPVFTLPFLPGIFSYLSMKLLIPVFDEIESKLITDI